ncbi:type I restriction enzyme S subunit [Metamycoplasma subdolum]|uniref:Type I restriction enzyme S subunit n=1 Tax=Metamycoplasma subdolum TaxID=92407 RepID=A0A3M0A731_9BACT|nr:restriction endonuclease subunit S [Metamycoplasma subdolum]RMA78618.1 type I restriction enzyme S subunit [Metamycoplasma subdolum]WPB50780.1 hypothetical protein R9C05_01375 [Metamycoplasma subdolum]
MIENYQKILDKLVHISTKIYQAHKLEKSQQSLTLGECCVIKTGKLNANQEDKNGKYLFFTCSQENLRINNYAFDGKAIIISGNGEFTCKYYEGKFNAYQRTYVLNPTKYFYLFLKEVELNINQLKNGSQGSVIKFITKGMLEVISIQISKDSNSINNKIKYIYNLISNVEKEIENLKKIKQKLLEKYF